MAWNRSEAVPRLSASLRGKVGVKLGVFPWKVESKFGFIFIRFNRRILFPALILVPLYGDQKCRCRDDCYHSEYGYCCHDSPRSEDNAFSPSGHESMESLLAEEIRRLERMLFALFGSINDYRRIDVVGDDLILLVLASNLVVYHLARPFTPDVFYRKYRNPGEEDQWFIFYVVKPPLHGIRGATYI